MPTELKLYNIRKWKWKVKPKSVSVIKWVRNCGNPRLWAIISRSIHLSTSTDKETASEIILASDYLSIDWAYIQPTDSYMSIILSIRLYRKSSKWNRVDCTQSIYLSTIAGQWVGKNFILDTIFHSCFSHRAPYFLPFIF